MERLCRGRNGKGQVLRLYATSLLLVILSALPAHAEVKVGLVDFQVLLSTLGGLERNRVAGDVPQVSQDVEAIERELQPIKERYARERARLSPEAREQIEQEILRRTEAIQRLYAKAAREAIFNVQPMSIEALREELERMIERFGRENGFALILDKRGRRVLYRGEASAEGATAGGTDVTQTLIEMLRRGRASGRNDAGTGQ